MLGLRAARSSVLRVQGSLQRGDRFGACHARFEGQVSGQHRITGSALRSKDCCAPCLLTTARTCSLAAAAHLIVVVFRIRVGVVILLTLGTSLFFLLFFLSLARLFFLALFFGFAGLFFFLVQLLHALCIVVVGFTFSLLALVIFVLGASCAGCQAGEMGEREPARRKGANTHIWNLLGGGVSPAQRAGIRPRWPGRRACICPIRPPP